MTLKIAAKIGERRYVLVDEELDTENPPADAVGRILTEGKRLSRPLYIGSIENHNPHMETVNPDEVDADLGELLQDIEVEGPPKDGVGTPDERRN
jgi:hypothetical protein